jgi:hypothetical protein
MSCELFPRYAWIIIYTCSSVVAVVAALVVGAVVAVVVAVVVVLVFTSRTHRRKWTAAQCPARCRQWRTP